ncbi:hypothetical protein [Roseovarius sp. THAF27]|uniref:hypothetical protein n=1 Tax=Roseovarius sp. THAF27 TaxID=2587850 RepID=UPI001C12A26A|nr:hypothetical protein [Roseovarius sp. THAF27]
MADVYTFGQCGEAVIETGFSNLLEFAYGNDNGPIATGAFLTKVDESLSLARKSYPPKVRGYAEAKDDLSGHLIS